MASALSSATRASPARDRALLMSCSFACESSKCGGTNPRHREAVRAEDRSVSKHERLLHSPLRQDRGAVSPQGERIVARTLETRDQPALVACHLNRASRLPTPRVPSPCIVLPLTV